MKIVLFGNAPDKIAAIRYRVVKFARMLEAEGRRCVICLPSSTAAYETWYEGKPAWRKLLYLCAVLVRRLAQVRHVIGADAVFFRGPLLPYGPPFIEGLIRLLNPRMIFDIDDAIWEPPAHVDSPMLRFVDFGWTRKMCRMCRHAVVGNAYLERQVREWLPDGGRDPDRVTIIPTCVDMEVHQPQKQHSDKRPVVLGWTGLSDNLGYLKPIELALQELARERGVTMHVASGKPYALEGVSVENEHWRKEGEAAYLLAADIGLMPLGSTRRAEGKCAFKALQYMAVGVPVVLSPVGMNATAVEDGVHGFHASTLEEWKDRLGRLIDDPALRQRMGAAAREHVARQYSHEANYPAFRRVIETVAAKAPDPRP